MDFELLLQDRLGVIRDTINKYGEDNFYLSFSGGKDSTILHYLLDMALPRNNIPRVFIDTGIEYVDVRNFVYSMKSNDSRFVIIKPSLPVKDTLEKYGCPFNKELKNQLDTMKMYLPHEYRQCNYIWSYVYNEYRRLNYRIDTSISIFD